MPKNVTYHNPIHQEENTPLVTIYETRVDTKQSVAIDARGARYVIDLAKASFGGTSYPKPGSQWYLKKISGVWVLMARAPRQNPQLDPSINPLPGEEYVGNDEKTVFVSDVQVNGNLTISSMIGEIRMWPTITAPTSWQLCDGSSLLRATYPTLFSVLQPVLGTATMTIASPCVVSFTGHGLSIGDRIYFTTTGALPTNVSANTSYWVTTAGFGANSFQISATQGGSAVNSAGSQSGVHTLSRTYFGVADATHFNVPDFRGRVPTGRDSSQTEFAANGFIGGEKTHTLSSAEIPAHQHKMGLRGDGAVVGGNLQLGNSGNTFAFHSSGASGNTTSSGADGMSYSNTGGGSAHNVLQPYTTINYIIKLI